MPMKLELNPASGSWSAARFRLNTAPSLPSSPSLRRAEAEPVRLRLRTESSLGMPVLPELPMTEPAIEDDSSRMCQTQECRQRFRTESTLGMPMSPWPCEGGLIAHLPPTTHYGWMHTGGKDVSTEGLTGVVAKPSSGAPGELSPPPPPGKFTSPLVPEGLSGTSPPPGNFALPRASGIDERSGVLSPHRGLGVMPQTRIQLSSLLQGPDVQTTPLQTSPSSSKTASPGSSPVSSGLSGPFTTIMLRNLPIGFTRHALLDLLDSQGFAGRYDFAYQPVNFDTLAGLSHAFVNMVSPMGAEQIREYFDGFSAWDVPSDNVCRVVWNDKQQGLGALVERYRNSPVMHDSVPDECKPVIILGGRRKQFPLPTQKIKAPRIFKNKV